MIAGIRIKVCGITTIVDAEAADVAGADFLGFNFYAQSPRHITLRQWQAMAPRLPPRKYVAIAVAPGADELRAWREAGFEAFQVHFPSDTAEATIASWSEAVGKERLWLAPRVAPEAAFPRTVLTHAGTVLWDTFSPTSFGGTGRTGDWPGFRAMREAHPAHNWILSGGLSAENVAAALAATGARWLDVNSGVESAPGVKDPARLQRFQQAVRAAAQPAKVGPT